MKVNKIMLFLWAYIFFGGWVSAATLNVSSHFGVPITVIPLSSGSFTATDVDGSGIDIRFTQSGDPPRVGFPRTFSQGGDVSIQGSAESRTSDTSQIATVLAPSVFARRTYTIEFFATGTTTHSAINNLSLTFGDVDEAEYVGAFVHTLNGSTSGVLSLSGIPAHVSQLNDAGTGVYLDSDSTSISNGSTGGDLDVLISNDSIDTFQYTQEKGTNVNLGLVMKLISFDVAPVPEPSSALLLLMSSGLSLGLRRRVSRQEVRVNQ